MTFGKPSTEKKKIKNELKCLRCGFVVISSSTQRQCAKCDAKMEFVTKYE